jgi:protein-S-isoprenylcysteine O-methyltransferase Ste14
MSGTGKTSLALRSILWTFAFPGFFTVLVPWRFFGLGQTPIDLSSPAQLAGVAGISAGAALLAACIVEFARTGRGTLSPVDPPTVLVVRGLYRYVRNPMYLAVTVIVLGESLLMRSSALGVYWAVWFLWANLFVVFYEEPALRRRFGPSYEAYTQAVGRWLPALRSRHPG